MDDVQPYASGEFYQRELPCLLAVLARVGQPINLAIIDGFVNLGERPGLGMHFWGATGHQFPIIGVAQSRFRQTHAEWITRGPITDPLYITSVGIDTAAAAGHVKSMHGRCRIPTLLNEADRLARHASAIPSWSKLPHDPTDPGP